MRGESTDAADFGGVSSLGYQDPFLRRDDVACVYRCLVDHGLAGRREGLEASSVYGLAGWLFLGGAIGARALFVVQYPETIHSAVDLIRSWQGGNVFYGCIMGGLAGSLIYWRRHPFPFWPMADAVAPALAVGVTLGRIGCFLSGCCFGTLCSLPGQCGSPGARTPGWHRSSRESCRRLRSIRCPCTRLSSMPLSPERSSWQFCAAYYPHRRRDGEVMALLDDPLRADKVADREPARRRAGDLRGNDLVSEHQSGSVPGGAGGLGPASARPAGRHVDVAVPGKPPGTLAEPGPDGLGTLAAKSCLAGREGLEGRQHRCCSRLGLLLG